MSCYRYHTIKSGSATVPYKVVASRTRSKSKNNQLSTNKIHKYLEYLEDTMLAPDFSDSEEFMDFLNSLTEEVPVSITPSKEVSTSSTCSSSGSSPVHPSSDSTDSVVPATSSYSSSGHTFVERTSSHSKEKNSGIPVQDDPLSIPEIQHFSGSSCEINQSFTPIESLPGFTELINTNVQVNTSLVSLSS